MQNTENKKEETSNISFKQKALNILTKFKNPKLTIPSIIAIVLIVIIFAYHTTVYIAKKFEIPKVLWANFSLEYRKIPFDTKTIEINFSTDLNKNSINNKSVVLSPFVEWKVELKNWNTLIYNLSSNLEIGKEYSLTISKEVESSNDMKIGKDYNYIFEAISWAKVTKILPEEKLDNIANNVVVLFNIPLLPLTTLDKQENLPCPIETNPKIEWTCKWTWWNVIEYIPKTHWEWATEYKVIVNSSTGLLYPLKEKKEITFRTPLLSFKAENTFSPDKWIAFNVNFPIEWSFVWEKLELKQSNNKIPIKLESIEWSDTRYLIKPKTGNFLYWKSYSLVVPKWISPKKWNLPNNEISTYNISSLTFVRSIELYQNIKSETWSIVDTKSFTDFNKIPNKDVFLKLTFDSEIKLDKSQFSFADKTWKQEDFDIKYWTEEEWKNNKYIKTESKKILILTFKKNLDFNKEYEFRVLKKSNPNLESDEIRAFKTAPRFEINSLVHIDNWLGCLYTNNLIKEPSYEDWETKNNNLKLIKITPNGQIRSIVNNYQWEDNKYICPQKSPLNTYILNYRLNPNSPYKIDFLEWFTDVYDNKIDRTYSFNINSSDIKEKDIYLYSSFVKNVNVIPSNVDSIINIQSINADKMNFTVCEMDYKGYLSFTNNSDNPIICNKKTEKEIQLKNKYRTISNNRFDIEKDILQEKINSPIFFIWWKTSNSKEYSFSQIIIKSNLSLTYEIAKNKNLLFTSSFDWKENPENLEFEWCFLLDQYWKCIKFGKIDTKFDNAKKVYLVEWNPSLIIAKNDKYYWMLSINNDQTSNYDFKYISGQDSSTKDFLYLYTERPIYRPGDTVFYKWLMRNFNFDWYHKSSIKEWKLKMYNESYEFFKELDIKLDNNSNFNWKFELPKEARTGRYSFEFIPKWQENAWVYNDAQFFIEEYKKPIFKVNIDWHKKDVVLWDNISIDFDWEYYFGGKLQQPKYYRSVVTQDYFFDAKSYSDYQFWIWYWNYDCLYWWYCNYNDNTVYNDEWEMKWNSTEKWDFQFPKEFKDENENYFWEKIYSFNVTLEDNDTKKQVTKTYNTVLHNTDAYVWLKTDYYTAQKDGIKFEWVVLDFDAKPIKWKNIKIDLIKKERKTVKKEWVDWIFYNDWSVEEKNEWTINVSSSDDWIFREKLLPKSNWEYEVKATYTWTNGKTSISSNYVYVAWEESYFWWDWNNTVTDLVADKNILKAWDVANFTLKSPVASGKIFVTIEKDDWILDYFTQEIRSVWDRISVPVKDTYYPNFYVKVFLIGQNEKNPLPIYKRALSVIKVTTDYKKLKVEIKPEKNHYLPWEKVVVNIKTTDENGKIIPNVNWSLSLVDESLLALKWNPKKNPYAFFYDMKRYLGVETYLSLLNLVEKLEIKDTWDWEKWWAWEWAKWGNSKKKRWVFKDTAFWQADFTTDKNWQAKITTENLPDNLTTWVIEWVASTSDDNKVGVWEATIVTTKKVIINDNLPRFLGSNDTITLKPTIFNKTGKNSSFKVSLKAENIDIEDGEQEISINNWEQKTIEFKVKIHDIWIMQKDSLNIAKINIKAISLETKEEDEIEKFLPIKETSTKETVSTIGKADGVGYTEKIDLEWLVKSWIKLVIRYSPTILSNILSWIDFLANNEYLCLEQAQSKVLPNIYLKKLYTTLNIPYDLTQKSIKVRMSADEQKDITIDELIKNYLAKVPTLQKDDGWYSYWKESKYADFGLTSIIISWVSEIKSIGYTINEKSIKDAIWYLKKEFYENKRDWCFSKDEKDCKYSEQERLSAISAIQEYDINDYEPYKMFKLLDEKNPSMSFKIGKINAISKFLKNNSITEHVKKSLKDEAIKITNNILGEYLIYNPKWAFLWKDDDYSRVSNTAEFVWALSNIWLENFKDSDQVIDNMNRWLISSKDNWSFGSTQENVKVIKNLTYYIQSSKELTNLNSNIKLILNWQQIDNKWVNDKNKLETFEKVVLWDKLNSQNDLNFNKEWNWKVYYDLSLSYYLPIQDVKPKDKWFYIEQKYYDYNEYKKIENLRNKELQEYAEWKLDYEKMKYTKDIKEYLEPINNFKVGQIILVSNKIATTETRDKVAFDAYIPAWSELINTNLATEDQSQKIENQVFDFEELRDEKFFWYATTMYPWIYDVNYTLRITHDWQFNLKPSQIFEFYNTEVFWQNKGRLIRVEK